MRHTTSPARAYVNMRRIASDAYDPRCSAPLSMAEREAILDGMLRHEAMGIHLRAITRRIMILAFAVTVLVFFIGMAVFVSVTKDTPSLAKPACYEYGPAKILICPSY